MTVRLTPHPDVSRLLMDFPLNQLKRNLRAGKVQTGCWLSLASHVSA